jgi:hypothetical protein
MNLAAVPAAVRLSAQSTGSAHISIQTKGNPRFIHSPKTRMPIICLLISA